MLTAAACVQVNEAVNSRDLECGGGVPEDICVRLADDLVSQWNPAFVADVGPIVNVTVKPMNCGRIANAGPAIVRCWEGMGEAVDGSIDAHYFQTNDGRIFAEAGRVVEN